jgi:endonuclease/exonuclease/phosphatase family metal-dependent hydrolase
MTKVRVTTVNGEWMNDWFGTNANGDVIFKEKFNEHNTQNEMDTDKTATKLSDLIKSIDPDIIGIQEGPSGLNEMLLFINAYLDDKYSCEISTNGLSQKLFILYRNSFFDTVTRINYPYPDWKFDKDGDYILDDGNFARTPLEVTFTISEQRVRIIDNHFKSSYINGGQAMWNDPNKRTEYIRESLINRRRITMEAVQLRKHVDETLTIEPNSIIIGDINDGPGKQYFENYMLGMDITSELLGNTYYPDSIFKHLLDLNDDYSAIFNDFVEEIPNRQVLLDRILVSPSLYPSVKSCNVEYQKYDAVVDNPDRRDGRPTDHRPVTLDLDLS